MGALLFSHGETDQPDGEVLKLKPQRTQRTQRKMNVWVSNPVNPGYMRPEGEILAEKWWPCFIFSQDYKINRIGRIV
jgi:hypothetical protein